MPLNRVVVTGMGAVSPLGRGTGALFKGLSGGKSGIRFQPETAAVRGLRSHVAGRVMDVDPKEVPRKYRRSMSAGSLFAAVAAQEALVQGNLPEDLRTREDFGVAIGSTVGSVGTLEGFFREYFSGFCLERMRSTLFFKIMNHSPAANVTQILGIRGRTLAPAAACSTGCQTVGIGFETIASGKQRFMLCGGTDEFHPLFTATFDIMNAASTRYNEHPHRTPRPFDRDRDGVVCAEGCGILLLESLESALERGAPILAEVAGFATLSDPSHIANPDAASILSCMQACLENADLKPKAIDYINAHATATTEGDAAECEAIRKLFGGATAVSSLKGHLGHTMAASGTLELMACIFMMQQNRMLPTLNLDHVDPACEGIRHVRRVEEKSLQWILKNNFALGGVNSSVLLRRFNRDG
ncbi:MAG: beta-ketoacyl-[acyl-carrier-protein] synthase family protein [Deltaproteobacteria bacterium]|nr:beta-ketoacyl-[acyl-carrier-protein] synthase family protein [Deltaproteobacteria bacterium]MBW1955084.1 beta-ketoacyl-[acyl-carrier-protein] synthase family protein [Deltaproteobacteria bacterium]MBW2041364.1 beta-ketoacyl-[acyl-carrier-protein] synthase family protein [Deltaproteobacteria bacterium]MBW2131518.1 beta-ketoacyl-[acyl-carrier-protein] synthase family protein [Deltaproteobacteria bacterium]